jgi:hypothetical protein
VVAEIATMIETVVSIRVRSPRVVSAIRENELYVFVDPDMRCELEDKFDAILKAYTSSSQRGNSV